MLRFPKIIIMEISLLKLKAVSAKIPLHLLITTVKK